MSIHARTFHRLAVARRDTETIAELVAATGLSRRTVQEALREPAQDPPPDKRRPLSAEHVAEWQARLPAPDRDLDHVGATADTAVRRAEFLHDTYWLDGAHLICVGDRDLTSLAVATVSPGVKVTVVDIDERVLAVIRRVARDEGLNVQTAFADLRLGPPASLREAGDLAFTDPPYTPEGIQLFAARALQMLRPDDDARVLLAYGYGEAQAALGYGVQEAIHELRLLIEALYPQFNRYVGAEAIGSASSLYVTRPTRRTWAAADKKGRASARIYSGGKASLESAAPELPDLGGARRERLEVDVSAHPALAVRVLLAAPARTVVLRGATDLPDLSALYTREGDTFTLVEGTLLRAIADRSRSKLANAWREAIIARTPMTKNEARALVAEHASVADVLERRLPELPRDALEDLLVALAE
ncbi:bis-aminopropyl spermidine synthase family protein [Solirubrobacter sp. CPCC 204708]|uniref:Bis-aminopropyl spermidine synthase family protein n=1 Tax=Solirubrobacter deserti TaxID=2282478 RepID=A0ABT4RP20_9ACTN|nr:bis-aminopropyl spermidine synthase family protein [Solirubrobacter deserti]MBE2317520.1 bis-aminopropyl spermidine synthase family protein [Solirubrobacter deserti]MDA0140304.1 bis-aminopropyl spermidine synthase family protein [Solirubrobacter deserti]